MVRLLRPPLRLLRHPLRLLRPPLRLLRHILRFLRPPLRLLRLRCDQRDLQQFDETFGFLFLNGLNCRELCVRQPLNCPT